MRTIHSKRKEMVENGNLGADWLVGMHEHFGRTGEYRDSDVYRLLGDQRASFDLTGVVQTVLCHDHILETKK